MDPFHLCLALGPIAVYALLIGAIHLARRPLVVAGGRDTAALGLAVSGMIVVGPVELFFPHAAASQFGVYVWLFLVMFLALCLVLVVLLLRPRLVVYNVTVEQLRPVLAELVQKLDGDARWAGDGLVLPNLGVQLHLETFAALRNVTLASTGPRQNYLGWRRLELDLTAALAHRDASHHVPRPWLLGSAFLAAGLLIGLVLLLAVAADPQAVTQSLFDMLRVERAGS